MSEAVACFSSYSVALHVSVGGAKFRMARNSPGEPVPCCVRDGEIDHFNVKFRYCSHFAYRVFKGIVGEINKAEFPLNL